jgi:hypothetical protein
MSKRIAAIMPIFLSPLTRTRPLRIGRAELANQSRAHPPRPRHDPYRSRASARSHWFPQQPDRAELWIDDVSWQRTGECCRNPVRNAWRGFLHPADRPATAPMSGEPNANIPRR